MLRACKLYANCECDYSTDAELRAALSSLVAQALNLRRLQFRAH